MIFSCSKCDTRYKLPDEKVANRVLKVRCKRCGVVIVVRDPGMGGSAPGEGSVVGAGAKVPWYVAVDGRQRGPMEPDGVRALCRAGIVTAGSFVWRPGLADWMPLGELAEAADWLGEPAREEAAGGEGARQDTDPQDHDPGCDHDEHEHEKVARAEEAREREEGTGEAEAAPEVPEGPSVRREEDSDVAWEEAARAEPAEDGADMEAPPEQDEAERVTRDADAESDEDASDAEAAPEGPSVRREEGSDVAWEEAARAEPAEDGADMEAPPEQDEAEASDPPGVGLDTGTPTDDEADPGGPPPAASESDAEEEELLLDDVELVTESREADPSDPAPLGMPALPPDVGASGEDEEEGTSHAPVVGGGGAEGALEPDEEGPDPARADGPLLGGSVEDPDARASLEDDLSLFDAYDADEDAHLGLEPEEVEPPDQEEEAVPNAADREFLKRAMREGASIPAWDAADRPSRAERKTLRQEFSVVAELDRSKRRRGIGFLTLAAVLVVAVVVAAVLLQSQRSERRTAITDEFRAEGPSVPVAEYKAVYDSLVEEKEATLDRPLTDSERETLVRQAAEVAVERNEQPRAERASPRKKKPRGKRAQPTAARYEDPQARDNAKAESSYRKLSAEEFAALTAEGSGKAEVKLDFDPTAAARKAESEADDERTRVAGERAEEVAKTFSQKRRQLARCKDELEEKVRAEFTVAPNGRVTSVEVTGTQRSSKAECVADILERAVFPAGSSTQTFAQSLTL